MVYWMLFYKARVDVSGIYSRYRLVLHYGVPQRYSTPDDFVAHQQTCDNHSINPLINHSTDPSGVDGRTTGSAGMFIFNLHPRPPRDPTFVRCFKILRSRGTSLCGP